MTFDKHLLVVFLAPSVSWAALNVETHAAADLVSSLRKSIYVDSAYLTLRRGAQCSSLAGPSCFQFLEHSEISPAPSSDTLLVDSPGVIPEQLLTDLGVMGGELKFETPNYNSLEGLRRHLDAAVKVPPQLPALPGNDAPAVVVSNRSRVRNGIVHFAGLIPDRRLPLTFSRGLPDGLVASWDGSWMVRDCFKSVDHNGTAITLALPQTPSSPGSASVDTTDINHALLIEPLQLVGASCDGLLIDDRELEGDSLGGMPVVEMAGNLGYLRFSKPVILRSLMARWSPAFGAPPAVISGRLGLNNIWTTHADPSRINHKGWTDITGGSLQPIDEVVFIATPGLELGGMWVVGDSKVPVDVEEDAEHMAMMLEPVAHTFSDGATTKQTFIIKSQRLSTMASSFVVTLDEAIKHNFQLQLEPSMWKFPHAFGASVHYPGLLSTVSMPLDWFGLVAQTNQAILEQKVLPAIVANFRQQLLSYGLPLDLRTELLRHEVSITEALFDQSPQALDHDIDHQMGLFASDKWSKRYLASKRKQVLLDYVTAALLYIRHEQQQSFTAFLR